MPWSTGKLVLSFRFVNVDSAQLNFNQDSVFVLNICLAIIMFGVALGLRLSDFRAVLSKPKSVLAGLLSQFVLLPAITFGMVYLLEPKPSIALGMLLVAACPGGNISNFMSHLADANAALSVSLTAFSTALSIVFTPLNLELWASLYPPTAAILQEVHLNPWEVFKTVSLIMVLPLIAGIAVRHFFDSIATALSKPLKILSILIFLAFVAIAFSNNLDQFVTYIGAVLLLVWLHNAVALTTGYTTGWLARLPRRDQRTLAIETGIQNSGLGLLLIFTFFEGLGGMALVAAWWGIWHIISGLLIAFFWSRKPLVSTAHA